MGFQMSYYRFFFFLFELFASIIVGIFNEDKVCRQIILPWSAFSTKQTNALRIVTGSSEQKKIKKTKLSLKLYARKKEQKTNFDNRERKKKKKQHTIRKLIQCEKYRYVCTNLGYLKYLSCFVLYSYYICAYII